MQAGAAKEAAMVELRGEYLGGLQVRMTHGPSGATMTTEAPEDNGGRGAAFSPTDLVATALGSCILTVMGIVAARDGVRMEGATVRVEKHMATHGTRRIARLPVTVVMPAGVPEAARKKLEATAHACPVHKSLHPEIDAPIRFDWG
jgi:putative redox protein